ncbi:hypothetical protein DFH06DRAFT_1140688 [Mycena polygramma]|nr:hypothetical protein DFH06DRAFT_1140688 [Mycena polygramma]
MPSSDESPTPPSSTESSGADEWRERKLEEKRRKARERTAKFTTIPQAISDIFSISLRRYRQRMKELPPSEQERVQAKVREAHARYYQRHALDRLKAARQKRVVYVTLALVNKLGPEAAQARLEEQRQRQLQKQDTQRRQETPRRKRVAAPNHDEDSDGSTSQSRPRKRVAAPNHDEDSDGSTSQSRPRKRMAAPNRDEALAGFFACKLTPLRYGFTWTRQQRPARRGVHENLRGAAPLQRDSERAYWTQSRQGVGMEAAGGSHPCGGHGGECDVRYLRQWPRHRGQYEGENPDQAGC